jgi:hypothetical protein
LQSLRFCKLDRLFQPYTYPQFGRWWSEWGAMAAGHSHSGTSSEWRCRSDTLKVMTALLILFVLIWLDLTTVRSKIFCQVYKINVHNSGSDILSWSPGWVLVSLWGRLIDPWASSSKLYVLWGADNLWVFGTAIENRSFQQLTPLKGTARAAPTFCWCSQRGKGFCSLSCSMRSRWAFEFFDLHTRMRSRGQIPMHSWAPSITPI